MSENVKFVFDDSWVQHDVSASWDEEDLPPAGRPTGRVIREYWFDTRSTGQWSSSVEFLFSASNHERRRLREAPTAQTGLV
jgi:hypothetical protein